MTSPTPRRPVPWVRVAVLATILLEVVVALAVSEIVGVGWTLTLLAVLSLAGSWVLVDEGRRAWRTLAGAGPDRAAAATQAARDAPGSAVGMGAGVLLAVPGFVTALVGALLLVPFVRRPVARRLGRVLARRGNAGPGASGGTVVMGEIIVSDVDEPGPGSGPGSSGSSGP